MYKTILIGPVDSGKSTILKKIIHQRNEPAIGLLDLDPGQSEGELCSFNLILYDFISGKQRIKYKDHFFIGDFSPKGCYLQSVVGLKKLLSNQLLRKVNSLFIDTSGWLNLNDIECLKWKNILIKYIRPDKIVFTSEIFGLENIIILNNKEYEINTIIKSNTKSKSTTMRKTHHSKWVLELEKKSKYLIKIEACKLKHLLNFSPVFNQDERINELEYIENKNNINQDDLIKKKTCNVEILENSRIISLIDKYLKTITIGIFEKYENKKIIIRLKDNIPNNLYAISFGRKIDLSEKNYLY